MTTRKSPASSGPDQPPAKRPRIADDAGDDDDDGGKQELFLKVLPTLAETGCTGVQELGRIEQTCKSFMISDDVWFALCCQIWPSSKRANQKFVKNTLGGYRGWCRFMTVKRQRVELPRLPLPEPSIDPKKICFSLDIYVRRKAVFGQCFFPNERFVKGGIMGLQLRKPIVLGSAGCIARGGCRCEKRCSSGEDVLQLQLSLLRPSDIVNIANAEQTSCTRRPRNRNAIMGLLEPIDDPKLDRYKRKGDDELFVLNSVQEIEGPRQYDRQGLLLRESSTASEIKCRLNYKPIDFHIYLQVDLIPPGNTFGIVRVILGVKYGTLVSRSETGDRVRWKLLCDDEAREEFGITPLHILEQLQGTDFTPSK